MLKRHKNNVVGHILSRCLSSFYQASFCRVLKLPFRKAQEVLLESKQMRTTEMVPSQGDRGGRSFERAVSVPGALWRIDISIRKSGQI